MKPMKKVLFTILILFIASCSKEISSDRIVEIDGLAYEENSNTPYSGKAITYNGKYGPDGKIIKNVEKNMLHGVNMIKKY